MQDLQPTIESIAPGFLPPELDIHPQIHDFCEPQPVKNAGVYFMRRIMHDWPDEKCVVILKQLVQAMGEDSKVLVADMVVPEQVQTEDTYVYSCDVSMMMFGGRERTRRDWEGLFEEAGLELVRVWERRGTAQAVVEGRRKRG